MSGHREVLETWFRKVWAEEDADAISAMMAPDAAARGLGSQAQVGPAEFTGFQKCLLELVSDVEIKIDKSVEDGEWIFSLCSITAKCRRSGKPITSTGTVVVKIVDGKLVEGYNHLDFFSIYEGLGLLPSGSFEQCLCGKSLS